MFPNNADALLDIVNNSSSYLYFNLLLYMKDFNYYAPTEVVFGE